MATAADPPVVIGALTRLEPESIRPFAFSLRRTGFAGKFVVVAGGYDESQLERLRELADVVVPVGYRAPPRLAESLARKARTYHRHWTLYERTFQALSCLGTPGGSRDRLLRLEYALEGLQSLRYGIYRAILDEVTPGAGPVLIADLRDVLFQSDPFAEPVVGLEVFLEDARQRLGSDSHNRKWLCDLYDQEPLRAIGNEIVSCSGTVMGERRAMMTYLDVMSAEVSSKQLRWRRPLGSHDQAIHNWLLYTGRLSPAQISRNEDGRVLTMGAMSELRCDSSGRLLNTDGRRPAILHQYDRHREQAAELERQLAGL